MRRLREALGPSIGLRIDANQGWDRPTALRAIRALEEYGPDFVEQPLPRWDLEGMAELARRVTVPLMADESCFTPQDALAIARLGGVSVLGLKLTKSAGILGSLAVARIAEAAGLTCYVGCMIETSLGTAAYLQVALAAAPVVWGCELFGPLLLAGDVVRRPVEYAGRRHPGPRRARASASRSTSRPRPLGASPMSARPRRERARQPSRRGGSPSASAASSRWTRSR